MSRGLFFSTDDGGMFSVAQIAVNANDGFRTRADTSGNRADQRVDKKMPEVIRIDAGSYLFRIKFTYEHG